MSLEPNGELVPVGGGDNIPLCREIMTLGRRESCDILMPFHNVSGVHCEFSFREGYWYLCDLGSTNGTKVKGVRLAPNQKKLLHPTDEITIAKRRYTIEYALPANQRVEELLEDVEEIMGQSLLEKAGLVKPERRPDDRKRKGFDPGDFLLKDDA